MKVQKSQMNWVWLVKAGLCWCLCFKKKQLVYHHFSLQGYWPLKAMLAHVSLTLLERGLVELSFFPIIAEMKGKHANFLNLGSELAYCHFCLYIIGQTSQVAKHKVKGWGQTLHLQRSQQRSLSHWRYPSMKYIDFGKCTNVGILFADVTHWNQGRKSHRWVLVLL